MTTAAIFTLYHSGAFLCAGIVAAYLALNWAENHIAWLETPGRKHYVTAFLAGLALVAVPASQGTTPNASMMVSVLGTIVALLLPGMSPQPQPDPGLKTDASVSPSVPK